MNEKTGIPDRWILLDSQSTVDVFMNKKLLKNICDAKNYFCYIVMLVMGQWTKWETYQGKAQYGSMKIVLPIYYHLKMSRKSTVCVA